MTLIINKSNSKNIAKLLTEKLKKEPKKGNLSKHFGKLKRNLDGLNYQTKIREMIDLKLKKQTPLLFDTSFDQHTLQHQQVL